MTDVDDPRFYTDMSLAPPDDLGHLAPLLTSSGSRFADDFVDEVALLGPGPALGSVLVAPTPAINPLHGIVASRHKRSRHRSGQIRADERTDGDDEMHKSTSRRSHSASGRSRARSIASTSEDRDVFDHSHFDYSLLQPIKGMNQLYNERKRLFLVALQTSRLFLACSSLMIVATDVSNNVPQTMRDSIGSLGFWLMTSILRFAPPVFFLLAYLQFNNYFAEKVYDYYLQRGAIIDYPETNNARYYVSNALPLAFLIVFAAYCIYAFSTFVALGGQAGQYVIMLSSLTHIVLYWARQQTVENQFISVTNFIQSFKDHSGNYNNIDDSSLRQAAKLMTHFTLIECSSASYSAYMRNFYFKMMGACGRTRWGLKIGVYIGLALVLSLTFVYSVQVQQRLAKSQWDLVINPCVRACVGFPDDQASPETCSMCLCRCLRELKERMERDVCERYLHARNCNVSKDALCAAAQALAVDMATPTPAPIR